MFREHNEKEPTWRYTTMNRKVCVCSMNVVLMVILLCLLCLEMIETNDCMAIFLSCYNIIIINIMPLTWQ